MDVRGVEMTAIEGRVLVGEGEVTLKGCERIGAPGGAASGLQLRVPIGLRRRREFGDGAGHGVIPDQKERPPLRREPKAAAEGRGGV